MTIRIDFLQNGAGIQFTSSRVVAGKEIIDANNKIYTPENLLRLKYKIVDRTRCTEYKVTKEDLMAIAEQERKAAKINPSFVVLLISPTPVQYGLTRMWQAAFMEERESHTFVFRDRTSAVAWLKENVDDYKEEAIPDI